MAKLPIPIEATQKYDGFRVQAHVVGGKARLISEDGGEVTDRFPGIVAELRLLGTAVLDGEITGTLEGEHMGRSKVSGYAHAKAPADDGPYTLNVFYALHLGGNDLHAVSLEEERKARATLKSGRKVKIDLGKVATTEEELRKAIDAASGRPGSEGAILKALDSKYPLSGATSRWLKAKKQWDIDGEVVEVHAVKGSPGVYNYLLVLRGPGGEKVPLGRSYNAKFTDRGGKVVQVPKGGIIRIAFGNLNKYVDQKTGQVWYNAWSPRAVEYREDRPRPE